MKATEPQSRKDLRSFIGPCTWKRRLIEGFANMAAPLNVILIKSLLNSNFVGGIFNMQAKRLVKEKPIAHFLRKLTELEMKKGMPEMDLGIILPFYLRLRDIMFRGLKEFVLHTKAGTFEQNLKT